MFDAIIFTDMSLHRQASLHLGPYKIAHLLRQQGYEVLVVNHLSHYNMQELKYLIDVSLTERTKFVGFSTTFLALLQYDDEGNKIPAKVGSMPKDTPFPQGREFGDEIFRYMLSKHSDVKFVIGGRGGIGYKNPYINYWVRGYAELSALNLMNHLAHGEELQKSTLLEDRLIVVNDPKAEGYNFTSDSMAWRKTDVVNHKVLPMETARGCIFNCKFCNFILNGKKNNDYIRQSDSLYQELLDNYNNFGITHYYFVDDTFNENIVKLKALAEMVERLPFKPQFWAFTRLELLCTMPTAIDLMDRIGVRAMFFGIETMNLETGRIVGKGYAREKQIELMRHVSENYPHITTHGSFIAGLPKEPYESLELTIQQLQTGEIPLHSWSMRPLYIAEHDGIDAASFSDIDLNWEKYGYKKLDVAPEGVILWENDQGLRYVDLFDSIMKTVSEAQRSKKFFVPGIDSFQLVNLGYELDEVIHTNLYGFNWDEVDQRIDTFVAEYKTQMIQILHDMKN